ncbi:cell division protein FtsL [Paracoccaceae bacterium]|nr:cell division protein FtsL [Paracoccaceae bacterium]
MVRLLLFSIVIISTFSLGLWAYKINYDSRAASQRVKGLEKSILSAKKEIKILKAEWAHLNNPDRLRKLVEYYFLELRLTPINPDDFISFSEIHWDKDIEKTPATALGKSISGIEHDRQ